MPSTTNIQKNRNLATLGHTFSLTYFLLKNVVFPKVENTLLDTAFYTPFNVSYRLCNVLVNGATLTLPLNIRTKFPTFAMWEQCTFINVPIFSNFWSEIAQNGQNWIQPVSMVTGEKMNFWKSPWLTTYQGALTHTISEKSIFWDIERYLNN